MTWAKKKDTDESSRFWSHVETVAERVRASDVYSNHRVPQQDRCAHGEQVCEHQESPAAQESHFRSEPFAKSA